MMEQYSGAIDLRNEAVKKVVADGEALGYEAKKAERFFNENPEAKTYAKDLIEFLSPDVAQGRFEVFCKLSKPVREFAKDLFLEQIKEKEKELIAQ